MTPTLRSRFVAMLLRTQLCLALTALLYAGGGSAALAAGLNVAAQVNGGVASASTTINSGYPVAAVNNGDRKGVNWAAGGGWNDSTGSVWPDWVQINFNGQKSISEIDVFTLQDSYANPAEPTAAMIFTRYGITAFDIQYWNGTTWVTVPGGGITGNSLVWRQVSFPAVTTDRIRVQVNASLERYSRIIEIEAYSGAVANVPPTVSLTSPTTSASYTAPASITLSANASDEGGIAQVEFFNGSASLGAGTSTGGSYTRTWNPVAAGSYTVTARATDNQGASTTSAPVSFTVAAPPPAPTPPPLSAELTTVVKTVTRTSAFEYDPVTGLLVKETIEPDQPQLRLDTSYIYDALGNRTRATVSSPATGAAAIVARTTSSTWDANGQFPVTTTNAVGHSESKVYDPVLGVVTSLTGPNGLTTTWQYDGFGRKTRETRADGSYTQWTYDVCDAACPPNGVYRIVTQVFSGTMQTAPVSVAYFDSLNRALRSASQSFDGRWVYRDTVYDNQGRKQKVSRPYFVGQPVYWVISAYDDLGRVLNVYEPDAPDVPALSVDYNGLSVSRTNRKGQVTTEVKNTQGQKISVTDAMGNVTAYAYDPFGNLIRTTDPAGNQILNAYDLRGRKTYTSDPDLGLWKYEYNVLGELTQQTDAKNQITTQSYDKLGRMIQRIEPGLTSSWVFDTAAYGKGKLYQATTSAGYVRTHVYDHKGRPQSTQSNLGTGNPTLWSSMVYDVAGRPSQQTYPNNVSIKQVYNMYGYLTETRNASTNALYWRADQMDADGHLLKETYGNGVVTERSYGADTGRIQNIVANTAGAQQIQGMAYVYDTIGNVTTYADGPGNQLEIRGGYDPLNRLTQIDSTINGVASSQTLVYDTLGNITSKTGVGNYAYGDALHKHAVTAVSGGPVNLSYAYDANGNLTGGGGRSVSWTAWNMPASVSQGGSTSTWSYGPEHDRYKMVTPGRTTWYLNPSVHHGGHYERTLYTSGTVEHRITLYGGSGAIGEILTFEVTSGTAPAAQTHYFHSDVQGSITAVTDSAGVVLTRFRYDAWGKQTLVSGSNTGISQTRQGHTSHEMLDSGLTHMNGRLYDPVLARFVSADPHVDNPFDLQSLNRYSYVNNNPLGFTDPSGYFKIFGKKWSWIRDKVVKPVVAAVVSYYTFNIGYWGVGTAVGGGTAGGVAGTLAGATLAGASSSLINTGSLSATWSYSANYAVGSYLTGGNYLQNPIDQFSSLGNMISTDNFGGLASTVGGSALSYGFSRVEARLAERWGISPMNLNTAFMGVSVLGNQLVGTRFRSGVKSEDKAEFPETKGVGFSGILNRHGVIGLPFDVIDIVLGYQGLPTASIRDYMNSGLYGRAISGHSLGTLDAINAYRLGLASGGGWVDAVPFGNVAPTALQVNLGSLDLVNGGWLGKIFNPHAQVFQLNPMEHAHCNYLGRC